MAISFKPPPTGETPEQRQTRETQETSEIEKREQEEFNKQKNKLKAEGDSIYAFSGQLAAKIPKSQGMTARQFENIFVPFFETGGTDRTAETDDTPYDLNREERPKVRIISKGDY